MPKIVVSRCSILIEHGKSVKGYHGESGASIFLISIEFHNFRQFRHFKF